MNPPLNQEPDWGSSKKSSFNLPPYSKDPLPIFPNQELSWQDEEAHPLLIHVLSRTPAEKRAELSSLLLSVTWNFISESDVQQKLLSFVPETPNLANSDSTTTEVAIQTLETVISAPIPITIPSTSQNSDFDPNYLPKPSSFASRFNDKR